MCIESVNKGINGTVISILQMRKLDLSILPKVTMQVGDRATIPWGLIPKPIVTARKEA